TPKSRVRAVKHVRAWVSRETVNASDHKPRFEQDLNTEPTPAGPDAATSPQRAFHARFLPFHVRASRPDLAHQAARRRPETLPLTRDDFVICVPFRVPLGLFAGYSGVECGFCHSCFRVTVVGYQKS